jgi:hypothetical protein
MKLRSLLNEFAAEIYGVNGKGKIRINGQEYDLNNLPAEQQNTVRNVLKWFGSGKFGTDTAPADIVTRADGTAIVTPDGGKPMHINLTTGKEIADTQATPIVSTKPVNPMGPKSVPLTAPGRVPTRNPNTIVR